MVTHKSASLLLLLLAILNVATAVYIPPGPKYECPAKENQIFPCKCDRGSDIGLYVTCDGGNLASLSIAFQNLANLNGSKIEEVVMKNSKFEHLYGSLFFRSNARIMKIHNVPIKTIRNHAFWGINNTLEELRIVNSSLIEFPREAFKALGNLKILELDHHSINALNNNEFDDSQLPAKLEKMYITNGNVSELGANTFQHLKKLKIIDLHGNKISALKKNQFRGLRDVEVLDVSFNEISKLDSSHIADLTKLTFCNASHNKLSELARGAFTRNAVLKVVNLAFNSIKRLDANSLRGMRFLR
jgi:Leucine-rich repeat (LRR) protein